MSISQERGLVTVASGIADEIAWSREEIVGAKRRIHAPSRIFRSMGLPVIEHHAEGGGSAAMVVALVLRRNDQTHVKDARFRRINS